MSVADAYVDLHVNGDNLEGEVKHSVKEVGPAADKEADKSGKRIGDRLGSGFLKNFGEKIKGGDGGGIGKKLKESFEGFDGGKLKMGAIAAALPLITSGASALSGALVAFTGAVVQAGGASLSFVGVLGSLIQAKIVAKMAFADFTKAVGGDDKALAKLAPNAQEAAKAFRDLSKSGGGIKTAIQQQVFKNLDGIINRMGKTTVPMLRKSLGGTGAALNGVLRSVGRYVTSKTGVAQLGKALQGNNRIIRVLGSAAAPILNGILHIFNALHPSSMRLAHTIASAGKAFGTWASAPKTGEKIRGFMDRAFHSAHNLFGIVKNLGKTLFNVFSAATPSGDGILGTLNKLSKRMADFTSLASSKNAIADWAKRGTAATGQMLGFLGKVGKMLLPLFNPSIASGYMKVFSAVLPVIVSIVKVVQSALAPVLERIGTAFAKNGPKFAGLFKALAPLLKGVGSVIGEIIGQSLDMLGTIASVITPVVGIISKVVGPILTRFAPIIATIILAFTNWGGAIVKILPIVGKFLAPMVELAVTLGNMVGPAFIKIGKVVGVVFKFLVKVVGGGARLISRLVGAHFTLVSRTVGISMRIVQRVISVAWRVIRTVFGTYLRIIGTVVRTYFNVYKTIVMAVFNVIRRVISVAWKVIRVVVGAGARFVRAIIGTEMAAARAIFSRVWGVMKGVASRAWNGIKTVVGAGARGVVAILKAIPRKILNLASNFLQAGQDLGKRVIRGIGMGLSAAGGFISDIGSSVKHAINSALHLPVHIKGPGPLPDFTIPAFARGTNYAPGGIALVGERGPELVNLPRGSQVKTAAETRAAAGSAAPSLPKKILLRIGSRDFEAYVAELADGRIDAADSLAWQGA